jgi:hypothetical protein
MSRFAMKRRGGGDGDDDREESIFFPVVKACEGSFEP